MTELMISQSAIFNFVEIEQIIVCLVVAGIFLTLVFSRMPVDAVIVAGVVLLTCLPVPGEEVWKIGVLSPLEAVSGFSNTGLITIAALFVVVTGLQATGAIDSLGSLFLRRPRTLSGAIINVFLPVAALSAFLNNTPVVAMLVPAVSDWAKRIRQEPSKLLIPLSYSAILGGTCSMIGTSTNLIVSGMAEEQGLLTAPLGIFAISKIGFPVALVGCLALVLLAPRMLPARRSASAALRDSLEYTVEMQVNEGSALNGKQVGDLNFPPGCYLIEIERGGELIVAVGPGQRIQTGDRLVFAGEVEAIRDLMKERGLALATDQVFKLDSPRHERLLFEAVVGPASPLKGFTLRESQFRNRYSGVVVAIARGSERIRGDIGSAKLLPGDVLLVEAPSSFEGRNGNDFILIKPLVESNIRNYQRAPLSIFILIMLVLLAASGTYSMFHASVLAALAMVATRCCNVQQARASIDWSVLIVIAGALSIGTAIQKTGIDLMIAHSFLSMGAGIPWLSLACLYIATSFLTELVTNNAAVAIIFPISVATANQLGVPVEPFLFSLMMAGSASFATPFGYQTNLLVYGPGGYRFQDFLKIGVLMNIIVGAVTIGSISYYWFL